ncbi:hypothetical protein WSM22_32640 [Cytophagales bacterium WSM2-2]|nr:hypothetical protein WSM22_32640 [Cytophagales bacterium WSM2-2]
MVFFRLLALILRSVEFRIPGYEDLSSNLRDIPLLIAVFYIRSPYMVGLFGFSIILNAPKVPLFSIPALMYSAPHVLGLLFAWYAFTWIKKLNETDWVAGACWCAVVLIYYYGFLITTASAYHQWFIHPGDLIKNETIGSVYISIVKSTAIEVTATALVTTFFLMQLNFRKALADQNKNLENTVRQRTMEIESANMSLQALNEELTASNEQIKSVNDNLEKMVDERTKKINDQLQQLLKYAHMNSHEVRAPLARMLGLIQLLKMENNHEIREDMLDKLYASSKELDQVIKSMTHLLNEEIEGIKG